MVGVGVVFVGTVLQRDAEVEAASLGNAASNETTLEVLVDEAPALDQDHMLGAALAFATAVAQVCALDIIH